MENGFAEAMATGRAVGIFEHIEATEYTRNEKLKAIKRIATLKTHSNIKPDKMLDVIRYLIVEIEVRKTSICEMCCKRGEEQNIKCACVSCRYGNVEL